MGNTKRAISTAADVLSIGPMVGTTRAAELQAGDLAPAFSLPGSDGRKHSLSDHRGQRVVVLAWFPRAFTGGCTKECKSLHENRTLLGDRKDVAYYLASIDDAETNKKFAESLGLTYPILSDPSREVARAYGVLHEGRELPERWTFYIGKDGKLLHVDRAVAPATAASDILARLDLLGVGRK
jgi:peroxiredoxin Q/BCP